MQIEWIAEGVRHHHGLGFALAIRGGQLVHAGVQRDRIVINEDRHESVLQDRRDRRGKSGGHRDDFVPGLESLGPQLVTAQGRDREQVC